MTYKTLWEQKHLDAADLAVIVAGDICEARINVYDYLKYYDNLDVLTGVRFCLLTGSEPSTIFPRDPIELEKIYVENILRKYTFITSTSRWIIRAMLKAVQYPIAQWKNCFRIEYCSLKDITSYTDIHDLMQVLREHLDFENYTRCNLADLPVYDWSDCY